MVGRWQGGSRGRECVCVSVSICVGFPGGRFPLNGLRHLGNSGNGGTTLEFLSPFLWRAPPLEMGRELWEILKDREAWPVAVHEVAKSQTQLRKQVEQQQREK